MAKAGAAAALALALLAGCDTADKVPAELFSTPMFNYRGDIYLITLETFHPASLTGGGKYEIVIDEGQYLVQLPDGFTQLGTLQTSRQDAIIATDAPIYEANMKEYGTGGPESGGRPWAAWDTILTASLDCTHDALVGVPIYGQAGNKNYMYAQIDGHYVLFRDYAADAGWITYGGSLYINMAQWQQILVKNDLSWWPALPAGATDIAAGKVHLQQTTARIGDLSLQKKRPRASILPLDQDLMTDEQYLIDDPTSYLDYDVYISDDRSIIFIYQQGADARNKDYDKSLTQYYALLGPEYLK